MNDDVLVVATYDEARGMGCHQSLGRMIDDRTGAQIVSVCADPAVLDGLPVGEIFWTPRAQQHRNAEKIRKTLLMNQRKTQGYRKRTEN